MLSLWLFFTATIALISAQDLPFVRIGDGMVQGAWKVSTKGRTFASFEGIPYARPPIGKYRFRVIQVVEGNVFHVNDFGGIKFNRTEKLEPQKLKPWLGVWDASQPPQPCLQYTPFFDKVVGSEDCLFVNVYSPNLHVGANLPVVVFIHGGAFMFGEGQIYDPSHLMDRDLVVVTLNHRLGPLGFLSTGDEVAPGNAGLKDQSTALRWVRDNILMFGGNPDSVTLTGLSSGSASVHYHYLSQMSAGLFHRGIAFSGSAFAKWTYQLKPAEKAKALAAAVGCPSTDHEELVDCLRNRPGQSVVTGQVALMYWKVRMLTPFTPTVENTNVRDPFLTQHSFHAAQAGAMHSLPLIASVTSEEGLYPAAVYQSDPRILEELSARWDQLASYIFEYNDTLPLSLRAEVAAKIKQKYLGDKPVGQETFAQLVQALGDRLFKVDVGKLAQAHAQRSGQPVFVYRYAFRGDMSLSNLITQNTNNYGVSHGDDVFRIFKYPGFNISSAQDKLMTEALLDMVYSYAATGTPKMSNEEPWTPVTPGSPEINYLDISSPSRMQMKTSSDFGQRSFWDSLGFNENENYLEPHARDEL